MKYFKLVSGSFAIYIIIFHSYVLQGVKAISGKRFKLIFLVLIYVVLKQTIYQQKALDLSFNLTS